MNNKTIIFSTIFFLLFSFVFLAVVEKKAANPNNQNVWMLYFDNPQNQAVDFKIENHSTNVSFHWQVTADKTIIKEGNAIISLGETKSMPVSISVPELAGKKITISVTSDSKVKEIYKILQ